MRYLQEENARLREALEKIPKIKEVIRQEITLNCENDYYREKCIRRCLLAFDALQPKEKERSGRWRPCEFTTISGHKITYIGDPNTFICEEPKEGGTDE